MARVIGDIPRIHARRAPQEVAYIEPDVALTWGDVEDRVTRLSHALTDTYGVREGDRVGVLAVNCHEFAEVMFAASRLAAIYTGLNTRHHPREMVEQMVDSGSKLLLVSPTHAEVGAAVAEEVGVPLLVFGDGEGGYEELLASASTAPIDPHGDENVPYTLTYTSGTTGEPKGAMISSRNEIGYAQALAWAFEIRHDDRFMILTPMFHKGGQFSTMLPAWYGRPSVIVPTPDPAEVFRGIEAHAVTAFVAVPTIMKMLADARQTEEHRHWDLSSIRHVSYGSNPIALPALRRFADLFSCELSQIGGVGTEGGIALVLSRVDHIEAMADPALEHRLTSCGRVQPGFEMMIVDENDDPLPTGELGEMVFRGDSFISGYWGRPEASENLWRNGWAHSGDIGRIDEDGYVYYVDRKAGRIKTGGETVYAREVEAILRDHDAVAEVAVVGVPDETWGEAVWAAVELVPSAVGTPPNEIEESIRTFARRGLSGYKVPKRVVVVDELPRTALGKIAIGDVRAALFADQAAEAGVGAS